MVVRVEQTFFGDGSTGAVPGNCFQAAVASLLELPLEKVPHFVLFELGWWDAFSLWLGVKGYAVSATDSDEDVPVLAFGLSPRGVNHAVVWFPDGSFADPHPSQAGFVDGPEEFWKIEKVSDER